MRLADARTLCPRLKAVPARSRRAIRAFLERLALWAQRWGPWAALDAPDGLLVDVSAVAHLFGGEARAARRCAGAPRRAAASPRALAIAPTAGRRLGARASRAATQAILAPARTSPSAARRPSGRGAAARSRGAAGAAAARAQADRRSRRDRPRRAQAPLPQPLARGQPAAAARPAARPRGRAAAAGRGRARGAGPAAPARADPPPRAARPGRGRPRRRHGARARSARARARGGSSSACGGSTATRRSAASSSPPRRATRRISRACSPARLDDVDAGFGIELVRMRAAWAEPLALAQAGLDAAAEEPRHLARRPASTG